MSMVAINLQKSFHRSPNTPLQEQPTRIFANNPQQFKTQKSIKSVQKHETKKEIQFKQLIRPTVATTAAEVKPETKTDKPQSQETKQIIAKELENVHLNEQELSAFKAYQNVRMPEQETSSMNYNKLNEAATGRNDLRCLQEISKDHQKTNKKVCRYLRSKRNRITKITPIHEEPEDLNEDEEGHKSKSNCFNIHTCWQANEQEVEMYQTKTKIYKTLTNTRSNCPKMLKQSNLPQPAAEKLQSLDLKNFPDIPTISGSLLQSSLQSQVALHPYGTLLENSNNDSGTFNHSEMIKRTRRRKWPRLKNFYWLFRPFRGNCRKDEPKIQAIVYKTYFVKWTKPPDTLIHAYGVKPLKSAHVEMSVLRRCRSAFF